MTDALRTALAHAREHYAATYDQESRRLARAESWQRIKQEKREDILRQLHVEKAATGATGTEQEVLDSLDRISLDGWRTRTLALPQLFAHARAAADTLVEPKIRHIKLEGATLRTPEDVAAWIDRTNQSLLHQIQHGPIVID